MIAIAKGRCRVNYHDLAYLHLGTVLPAFVIGTYLMMRRKGTVGHRRLGRVYLVLMMLTGLVTLFMPALVGPRVMDHFGFIHGFSLLALWTAPSAYLAARRGDVRTHRGNMIGLYIGGVLIAGAFAFMPGRMLHGWLFG